MSCKTEEKQWNMCFWLHVPPSVSTQEVQFSPHWLQSAGGLRSIINAVYHHLDLNTSPEQLNQLREESSSLRARRSWFSPVAKNKGRVFFFSADDESPSCMSWSEVLTVSRLMGTDTAKSTRYSTLKSKFNNFQRKWFSTCISPTFTLIIPEISGGAVTHLRALKVERSCGFLSCCFALIRITSVSS